MWIRKMSEKAIEKQKRVKYNDTKIIIDVHDA